jgi:thiamine-monophosphate kinase
MRLSDIGEFGLIERIRRSFAKRSIHAPVSIGDDAAALLLSPGTMLLATTDMLIEGVHFDLATADYFSLGWKSAAVNLSDIAAMGGAPRFCLAALALPNGTTVEEVREFYRGFMRPARKHGVLLVGGDTCRSKHGLVVTITVLGEAKRPQVITRAGARPGDLVFVTGTLGDSGAGLELLKRKTGAGRRSSGAGTLIERHLRPVPRIAWGRKLAESGCVSSMIDVSDGLSSDLGHLCEESAVGAEILEERLPLSAALRKVTGLRHSAAWYALSGGEDYELLFTVRPDKRKKLLSLRIPATEIGRITRAKERTLILPGGTKAPLVPSGYDHFRGRVRSRGSVKG